MTALKAYARGEAQTVPTWSAVLEFAHEFGMPPGEVGKTSARWWYRWRAWRQANATREAYAAAKYYKPHEVPPELRAAMEWARDAAIEYVLNPETQTFEQVTHGSK